MATKKHRQSKRASRKPVEKSKQICMKITSKRAVSKDKTLITDFVRALYTNKRWDEPMDPEDFFVVMDTREKRICIELYRKVNANYLKLEDIHAAIKPKHLKVNADITLSKPESDVLVHHLASTKKIKVPEGHKWVTLSHNGPYFTWIMEPYEPHGTPLLYGGKKYKLSQRAEQVANLWAKRMTTDETATIAHTEDHLFRANFWKDFKTYLSPANKKAMKDFNKMDFSKIQKKIIDIKSAETSVMKRARKKSSEERKHNYGYAIVNGVKEKVSNFVPEPAGLFLGRGKNKLRGRVKRDINPSEVIINIDKGSKVPTPPKGKWKKVVHDTKARWMSKWTDPLNGKPKYIYLSDEGQFKSSSDADKFENARKLNVFLETVRKGYRKNLNSSDKQTRQLANVIALVDQYGIRMGGEKGELEAKTYGASTLLVDHITFTKPDKIHLQFLGKDSILYDKILTVSDTVFKNLKDFAKGKSKKTTLFDLVRACDINNYLQTFDKGFSGKVFRTRLASTLMYNSLSKSKLPKKATVPQKKKAFVDANIVVAKALNHIKTIAKGAAASLENAKQQLKDLEKELKEKKKGNRSTESLEKRVQAKKDQIDSKNKLNAIATSTSLTNYIDPRLVTAWCKAHDIPVDKVYTKTLYNKFKWAIDDTGPDWDYEETELLQGFEHLQPSKDAAACELPSRKPTGKPTRKPRKVTPDSSSEEEESSDDESELKEESSSEDDKPLLPPPKQNKMLIRKYHQTLQKYGYALVKLEDGQLAVQRMKPARLIMQISSTYKNIYTVSNALLDERLGTLVMLLIGQVCRDATKDKKIKKAFVKSGYINRYKEIVRKSV